MKTGLIEARMQSGDKTRRASVSLPQELYGELSLLAKRKKVSPAWIIREVAEKYIKNNFPIFEDHQ
jgi:predicted DNA-binding protein